MNTEEYYGQNVGVYDVQPLSCIDKINHYEVNLIRFLNRMISNMSLNDYSCFFKEHILNQNTFWIDFSHNNKIVMTKEVFSALPPQITTVEVSCEIISSRELKNMFEFETFYDVPTGLEFAPNVSKLIMHMPKFSAEENNADVFLKKLHNLTSTTPNLKEIYFVVGDFDDYDDIHDVIDVKYQKIISKILKHLSPKYLESCVFYKYDEYMNRVFISKHSKLWGNACETALWMIHLQQKSIPVEIIYNTLSYINEKVNYKNITDLLSKSISIQYVESLYKKPLKEHGIFNQSFFSYLNDNRHLNPDMQHAYDSKYGLITTRF